MIIDYQVQRHVEVTKVRHGLYVVRCQNKTWEVTTKRTAAKLKRMIESDIWELV